MPFPSLPPLFFPNLSLPSSFLSSFKAPLGSLFRNYNHSGFRQFDQMQGLHVRIGRKRKGRLGLQGEPWGELEWNYQFNGWSTAQQRQTVDIKWGLSDFKRGRKVPQRLSSPQKNLRPQVSFDNCCNQNITFCQTHSLFLWKTQRFERIMFSKHLIHLQITESVSLLLSCCGEVSGQTKYKSLWLMTFDRLWRKHKTKKDDFIYSLPKLLEYWIYTRPMYM